MLKDALKRWELTPEPSACTSLSDLKLRRPFRRAWSSLQHLACHSREAGHFQQGFGPYSSWFVRSQSLRTSLLRLTSLVVILQR